MPNSADELFLKYQRSDYQRDNFDKFLKKVSFHFAVPAIHIAGTNGKGSTASFLSHIYQKQGYKVGLFTSPYFDHVNEMIKIGDNSIPDEDIKNYIDKYDAFFSKYNLSSFEVQTFIALTYFQDQKVDLAVIECGMGGEEDATNIFTPILSIITSVSLEHTEYLGTTVSEIAFNKAGIIKSKVPVLVGKLDEEALIVISDVAKRNSSILYQVDDFHFEKLINNAGYQFSYTPYKYLYINFPSLYSIQDACLAIEAVKILGDRFPIGYEHLLDGLKENKWPARMEIVQHKPLVIIDGAHNPEGIQKLVESMEKLCNNSIIHVVFACFKDKNIENMLSSLNFISNDIVLTSFPHHRARTEENYFLYLQDYKYIDDYHLAIKEMINNYPDDVILITGSLAFAALARKMFIEG